MKKVRLIDRRAFLKEGLLFGVSLSLGLREFCKRSSLSSAAFLASPRHNHKLSYTWEKPLLDPYALRPFVDPLPIMPIARPTGHHQPLDGSGGSPVYSIKMKQVHLKLHRDLKPTLVWGYNGLVPGPTFETQSGQSILVNWISDLPTQHFLTIDTRSFAVWGLAFKPRTDDMREAPSLVVIEELLAAGARVQAHDPEALASARRIFGDRISYYETNYNALVGAEALIILTEWDEFRHPNFHRIKAALKQATIFDGHNLYDPALMRALDFRYYSIGRRPL